MLTRPRVQTPFHVTAANSRYSRLYCSYRVICRTVPLLYVSLVYAPVNSVDPIVVIETVAFFLHGLQVILLACRIIVRPCSAVVAKFPAVEFKASRVNSRPLSGSYVVQFVA